MISNKKSCLVFLMVSFQASEDLLVSESKRLSIFLFDYLIFFLCSVIFYKYLSYAIKFLWIFKFIMMIITLADANWQQWAPQADMLHVLWRIQIFCIQGTTIVNYVRFFISNKIMQLNFCEYLSLLSLFWLLCIWGPGPSTDSVFVFL